MKMKAPAPINWVRGLLKVSFIKPPLCGLNIGSDSVIRVRRNKNIACNVHASPFSILECDHGETIEKVIQNLLCFLSRLSSNTIADRGAWIATVDAYTAVSDLCQASYATDRCGGCKGWQVAM